MPEPETLSTLAHFYWGCLGGLIAFLATFALPELRAAAKAQNLRRPTSMKVLVIALLAVVLIALGGGGAILIGDATLEKQAVVYGIGAEGIIGGFIRTAVP